MKNTLLITIVVPVYNIANYLPECLDSIISQTYSNLEILVIDDGSTDASKTICDDYAKKDSRIIVFHRRNAGLSAARNYGINKAHGTFIAFIDGDDSVAPDFIRSMIQSATKHHSDIVICGYQTGSDSITLPSKTISGTSAAIELLTKQENYSIVAWNKLYLKTLFDDKIRYPVGIKHEDSLTTYKLLAAANNVTYLPDCLYNYRIRRNSIMHQAKEIERLRIREQSAKEAIQYFKNNSSLRQSAEMSLLLAWYAFLDAATHRTIPPKYYQKYAKLIKHHLKDYQHNPHITKKLKLYNRLIKFNLYRIFRTIV